MTTSRLLIPPQSLSSCVFAAIYRNTRGAILSKSDRINHFPASPLVTVTVVRHGQLMVLSDAGSDVVLEKLPPLPRVSVTPPKDAPISSWSPGSVEAIAMGVFPDAWLRLGGTPDFATPPDCIQDAIDAFDRMNSPDDGWAAFCDVLEPIWSSCRDASWRPTANISDWARSLISRAALSGQGKSMRSLERHLKRLSGHTKRTLDFYTSFENLHKISIVEQNSAPADIAVIAGYSDQSHMGRSVRRATGFSPASLNRAIQTEEAFWCYRLLGQRF